MPRPNHSVGKPFCTEVLSADTTTMRDKALPSLPLLIPSRQQGSCQDAQSATEMTEVIRTLQKENERLHLKLAYRQKSVQQEENRTISALREQNLDYQRRIDQLNHHIARIANTLREVFASCSDGLRHEHKRQEILDVKEEIQVYSSFENDSNTWI